MKAKIFIGLILLDETFIYRAMTPNPSVALHNSVIAAMYMSMLPDINIYPVTDLEQVLLYYRCGGGGA